MCEKVITSKGKQKKFLCDYCGKTFDKNNGKEMKLRNISGAWWWHWGWYERHFICDNCYHSKRLYLRD